MHAGPRIRADFNYGGREGDTGVVYLGVGTRRDLELAGIELRDGISLTLSDYDGSPDDPTWLVADGVVSYDESSMRWKFRYPWDERRWESRD